MPGFEEILGHDQIKEHFKKAIEIRKISHAYLLNGEAGMGKKSLAAAFALTLFCQGEGKKPCLDCHACRQVLSNNHPDLIYVTHEKPASIGVDDIREQINESILIRPYSSSYKIYIVNEAEKMTVQAQNALLKTIEEPPDYAVILLLATSQEAFLPTILSRCVQLKLKPLQDTIVKKYLMEKLQIQETEADTFTVFARGNLGRAISIAASEEFRTLQQEFLNLLKNIYKTDISEMLDEIRKIKEEKLDFGEFLNFAELWYRDILLDKATQDTGLLIFKEEHSAIRKISDKSSYRNLEKVLDGIKKARIRLNSNVSMELTAELLLLIMKENTASAGNTDSFEKGEINR